MDYNESSMLYTQTAVVQVVKYLVNYSENRSGCNPVGVTSSNLYAEVRKS